MILAQRETSRSKEQNREFRTGSEYMDTWHTSVVGKIIRESMNFLINEIGMIGHLVGEKNVIGSWFQTIHKDQVHVDKKQIWKTKL